MWRRRLRVVGIALLALVVLVVAGFYAWTRLARYAAFPEALAVAGQAERTRSWYVFPPSGEPTAGFVFYPGGLVDPTAYAPLMQRLADGGLFTVLVPMPLDLAVLGIGRAAEVIAAYPQVDLWGIGGHSLGGAMAAEFVKRNPEAVAGIALLAAYSATSTDLSTMSIHALSVYGSEDGLTSSAVFEASLARLPTGAELVLIEGGNHAQFGHYGPQAGDGVATIEREEQQRRTAEAILALAQQLQ